MELVRLKCHFFRHRLAIVAALLFTLFGDSTLSIAGALANNNQCLAKYSKLSQTEGSSAISIVFEKYMNLLGLPEVGDRTKHLDEVKILFSSLSNKKKIKVLKFITENYIEIKTNKYSSSLSTKKLLRHFDVILSLNGNAYDFFNNTVVSHLYSLEKALQLYYKIQALRIGLVKQMDVENLLYVAYKIQDTFKDEPLYRNEKIYLYGSFVNGRGISELSDLDFAISNAYLASKVESLKMDFSELYQFKLSDAQAHMAPRNKIHQYGYINPLVVVIYQNSVEIRIYKSKDFKESQQNPYFLSLFI